MYKLTRAKSMSGFLENQKKKEEKDETSSVSPQTPKASADEGPEEDEVAPEDAAPAPEPDEESPPEGPEEEKGYDERAIPSIHQALEDERVEVARLAKRNEELEEELRHARVQVQNLNRQISKLRNIGNR